MVHPPLLKIDMVGCWKYRWNSVCQSRTGRSATVSEFRGRLGNDDVVGVISFLEIRKKNQRLPSQASKEGCGSQQLSWRPKTAAGSTRRSATETTSRGSAAGSSPPLQELARCLREA